MELTLIFLLLFVTGSVVFDMICHVHEMPSKNVFQRFLAEHFFFQLNYTITDNNQQISAFIIRLELFPQQRALSLVTSRSRDI